MLMAIDSIAILNRARNVMKNVQHAMTMDRAPNAPITTTFHTTIALQFHAQHAQPTACTAALVLNAQNATKDTSQTSKENARNAAVNAQHARMIIRSAHRAQAATIQKKMKKAPLSAENALPDVNCATVNLIAMTA